MTTIHLSLTSAIVDIKLNTALRYNRVRIAQLSFKNPGTYNSIQLQIPQIGMRNSFISNGGTYNTTLSIPLVAATDAVTFYSNTDQSSDVWNSSDGAVSSEKMSIINFTVTVLVDGQLAPVSSLYPVQLVLEFI